MKGKLLINRKIWMLSLALALVVIVGAASAFAEPWKFGVMSDTQWPNSPDGKNPNVATNIIKHLNQEFINKHVKFVIQVGDLTDKPSSTPTTTNAENLDIRAAFAQPLYDAGIGFFPLRGNHEDKASSPAPIGIYAVEFRNIFPQTGAVPANAGLNNMTPAWAFDASNYALLHNTPSHPYIPYYLAQAYPTTPNFTVGTNFATETTMEGLTYSFDYDNARFVLADQFTKPNNAAHSNLDATDVAWIGDRFASRPVYTHAFSFAHKHLVSENHADNMFNSTNPTASQPSKDLMATFMKRLQTAGVRYHIGGHDHMHNRAIISSPSGTVDGVSVPTGAFKVQNIIAASDSYKFYTPPYQTLYNSQLAFRSLEKPISQEIFTLGYYIFTVDGPKVTADFYSMPSGCGGDCDQTYDVLPYEGNTPTSYAQPNGPGSVLGALVPTTVTYNAPVPFTLHETFGYSLNGIEKVVDQGASYALTDNTNTAIANGETGYKGTTAEILSGTNGSTGKDYNYRPLAKSVNTGWAPATAGLASDIFTLWGMQDNVATKLTPVDNAATLYVDYEYVVPDTTRTDTYALSMSYDDATFKSRVFGLSVIDQDGNAQNAIVGNGSGSVATFVNGPYNSSYPLGTYGVDTATKTAWAVINHASDFAVAPLGLNDVSAQISATTSGFVYNRATQKYTGKLTITNTGAAISTPVAVALNGLTGNVTLSNALGSYNGAPYTTVTNSGLAAGASIAIPVSFSNPSNAKINFNPVTFQE